jgi:hypothetical protein
LVTIPQNALRFGVIVQKLKDLKTIKNVNEILSFLVGISNQQKNVVDQSILKLGLSKLELEKPIAVKEKLVEKASVFNHYYQKSSEITERDLIRELLFAFQGIDGQFIQFDTIKNQYVIDKQLELPKTTVQLISRLLRLGWVFRQIQTLLKDQKQGLYRQSFLSSVKDEVQEYYRLLAILESQLDKSDQQGFTSQQLSLKRLFVWTAEPMIKMRMLLSLLETCKNLKGGEIITAVQRYAQHGDPLVVELIQKLLKKVLQRNVAYSSILCNGS